MFRRILIANRGEIAVRIIRCCREMQIESVVVYSSADEKSLPVMLATHAVCIGPAKASESYLKQDVLIETALRMECDAIHPGYGFLSENADFAKKCEENGIVFIGPSADIIQNMGDKQSARKLMMANEVPVVPGSKELITQVEQAQALAETIGYPVLLKASAGGGGKGMRRVFAKDEITAQKLMVTFGRVMPLQNQLVGSYANSRGVSQIFEAPPSYEKWVRDFDSTTGYILLVSLCCL